MRALRLVLLIAVFAFVFYVRVVAPGTGTTTAPGSIPTPRDTSAAVSSGVPQKAIDVLRIVRTTGEAPPGYVGGRVFENREGRLPAGADYHEFDVDPHDGQRDAERLIVEWSSKKAWYTGDHYRTFTPLP